MLPPLLPFRFPAVVLAITTALAVSASAAPLVQRGSRTASVAAEPVALVSPLPGAPLSSAFGLRKHPILGVTMMHEGVDLAAPPGTAIAAAGPGIVLEAGYGGGYGNFVRLRHVAGLETVYGHMSRIAPATIAGARISSGEIIGFVGSTGLANGPHLHFEVREDGLPVDPARHAAVPSRIAPASDRPRQVEIVRGGQSSPVATGGPQAAATAGVVVVRGGRR